MRILEYTDLELSGVERQYRKLIASIEADDFRSADVRKLSGHDLYRAKLDDSNRLIFKIVTHRGVPHALVLEVVRGHAYERAKFLKGARIDESKIPPAGPEQLDKEPLPPIVYLNPSGARFHVLDKILSFDPEQEEIYRHPPPLVIIGPAGSGKTALALEKMKRQHGRVVYVTLSPFLADNARNIYCGNRYENDNQEVSFLSFREFLETTRVPEGREIRYGIFTKWLLRIPRQQRVADAHRLYEEFRGVITGSIVDSPWLTREEYLSLGVRQSIYPVQERDIVYTLFEKYLVFLREGGYYDPNVLAHDYLKHVRRTWDFAVVDEVQDITNIQLQLILSSLKKPDDFILSGDSNQIVHPNFFSWSSLKTMLFTTATLESRKVTRILHSNFRNAETVTSLANKILRIKQKRFGSIDRESTYLMNSLSEEAGEVAFVRDSDKVKRELNQRTRRSTSFAVLVMRDDEKAAVRQFFDTPLLFSIKEAKGLEYENVILVNFISGERGSFQEIISGVFEEDLEGELRYMRAPDKTDKSLETYKFFINSLYVAVTRAVRKIYLIESDTAHPLIRLLGFTHAQDLVTVEAKQSSFEEWQAEARKLELQGRQEQADEIRRDILKSQPVPWEVCTTEHLGRLVARVRDPKEMSQKPHKTLFEYGLFFDEPELIKVLSLHGFDKAKQIHYLREGRRGFNRSLYEQQRGHLVNRYLQPYTGRFCKDVLRQCEAYGVNHRTVFNSTPLMLAAAAGNAGLVEDLMKAGADADLTDNSGFTAWQKALERATGDKSFAAALFPAVYELLAPSSLSVRVDDRLIKIDRRQGEFLLFHVFRTVLRRRVSHQTLDTVPLTAVMLGTTFSSLPDSVVPQFRKQRAYISSLLSKNEIGSANPYGSKLFKRLRTGHYVLNPSLALRAKEEWSDVYGPVKTVLSLLVGSESEGPFRTKLTSLLSDKASDPAQGAGTDRARLTKAAPASDKPGGADAGEIVVETGPEKPSKTDKAMSAQNLLFPPDPGETSTAERP